jgi:hypothetical protein
VIALADGDPFRVIAVLQVPADAPCVPVLARRIALAIAARSVGSSLLDFLATGVSSLRGKRAKDCGRPPNG